MIKGPSATALVLVDHKTANSDVHPERKARSGASVMDDLDEIEQVEVLDNTAMDQRMDQILNGPGSAEKKADAITKLVKDQILDKHEQVAYINDYFRTHRDVLLDTNNAKGLEELQKVVNLLEKGERIGSHDIGGHKRHSGSFESDLDKASKSAEAKEAQARAKDAAEKAAERERAAAKARDEQNKKALQDLRDRETLIKNSEKEAGDIIASKDKGGSQKVKELQAIQEKLGLDEQGMREFLGRVFNERGGSILNGISNKTEALRLKADMEQYNEAFGNKAGKLNALNGFKNDLWENNWIERDLDGKISQFEKNEKVALKQVKEDEKKVAQEKEKNAVESEKKRIWALEMKAAKVLNDKSLSASQKVQELQKIEKETGYDSSTFRTKFLKNVCEFYRKEIMQGLSKDDMANLRGQLEVIRDHYKAPWEVNPLRDELKKRMK